MTQGHFNRQQPDPSLTTYWNELSEEEKEALSNDVEDIQTSIDPNANTAIEGDSVLINDDTEPAE